MPAELAAPLRPGRRCGSWEPRPAPGAALPTRSHGCRGARRGPDLCFWLAASGPPMAGSGAKAARRLDESLAAGAYSAPAAPPGASACRSRASPPSSSTSRHAPHRAPGPSPALRARGSAHTQTFVSSGSRPGSGFTRGGLYLGGGGAGRSPVCSPSPAPRLNSLLPRGNQKGGFLGKGERFCGFQGRSGVGCGLVNCPEAPPPWDCGPVASLP